MSLEEPETGGQWATSLSLTLRGENGKPTFEMVSERDGETVTDIFGMHSENPKLNLLCGALDRAGDGRGLKDPAILLGLVKDCIEDPDIVWPEGWLYDFGNHLQEICDFGKEPDLASGPGGTDGGFSSRVR